MVNRNDRIAAAGINAEPANIAAVQKLNGAELRDR